MADCKGPEYPQVTKSGFPITTLAGVPFAVNTLFQSLTLPPVCSATARTPLELMAQ